MTIRNWSLRSVRQTLDHVFWVNSTLEVVTINMILNEVVLKQLFPSIMHKAYCYWKTGLDEGRGHEPEQLILSCMFLPITNDDDFLTFFFLKCTRWTASISDIAYFELWVIIMHARTFLIIFRYHSHDAAYKLKQSFQRSKHYKAQTSWQLEYNNET